MKKLLIILAIILFPVSGMAETVWVHGSGGSRMLDIQRGPGGQVQIWDFTNGGVTVGQKTGTGTHFQNFKTGESTWIDGQGLSLDDATDLYIQHDD